MANRYVSANPRIRVQVPVVVEWKNQDGLEFKALTFSENISFGGICILLDPKQLDPHFKIGQIVRININSGELNTTALVRHITRLGLAFTYVGLELSGLVFDCLSLYKDENHDVLGEIIPTFLPHPERRLK
ncbi:MAG: PilZ domain-containing protein [Acidobacteriota bacterium]